MNKRIAILGSTGSIGTNTLNVVSRARDKFEIIGLSADSNIELLAKQSKVFHPKIISVRDSILAAKIKRQVRGKTKILHGVDGLKEIASRPDVDMVIFAISGSPCLTPLLEAIKNKKEIALANKESLVSAGSIVMKLAKGKGVKIIPIDSEHSAIFQCLEGKADFLYKIYLTGSGGPLLKIPRNRFDSLTRRFILKHPKWKMGKKISVDSATMMNKGLEIIEAKYLFNIDEKFIEVLIHPEAVIHSMVELTDGTIFAQLGIPDMRIPIQYALTYPERFRSAVRRVDFSKLGKLTLEKPDIRKFPCLRLAREALKYGGTHPAVLNASDEEAVKRYLDGAIKFSDIAKIIDKVLSRHRICMGKEPSIDDIIDAEEWAREEVNRLCYH